MTDSIREALRVALARRDWNRTKLAQETDLTRQYVGELMTGKAGNLSDSWGRIFDELGLELVLQPKRTGDL
jgi:Arc/MetJ-type ribon-helix-helix transcriptional regulator